MVRCPGKRLAGQAAGAEDGIRTPEMARMEKMFAFAFALTEPDVRGPPAGDDGSVTMLARAVAAVKRLPSSQRAAVPAARGAEGSGRRDMRPLPRWRGRTV